jgi:hypothetical protein
LNTLTPSQIVALPEEEAAEYLRLVSELEGSLTANPLQALYPHPKQREFAEAAEPLVAVFAGNRFGKTHILVSKCLIQHTPLRLLPERLHAIKLVKHTRPVKGRFMCPSEKVLHSVILPKFRELCPRAILLGKSFEDAWDKSHLILRFADGGQIDFYTYQQDADKLVGADLDYVAYDEPPPEPHRNENLARLIDRNGCEWFALTPVNISGGGIGWLYREVWKKREAPGVRVINGSIQDNPTLDPGTIERILSQFPTEERAAREHGRFIHFGGMVYPGGFERVLTRRPVTPEDVREWEVVVGIDPGLKNAAFVWEGFDSQNRAFVFDEVLLQEKTPTDYARAIRAVNAKWRIVNPIYVIDPSARNRGLVNKESVQAELQRHGIPAIPGQNDVQAGVQQIRRRMDGGMFFVDPRCRLLRDEAEEYRMHDDASGEFRVVKEKDHALDACRYACMHRPWYAWPAEEREPLGWNTATREVAHIGKWMRGGKQREAGPLGSFA